MVHFGSFPECCQVPSLLFRSHSYLLGIQYSQDRATIITFADVIIIRSLP